MKRIALVLVVGLLIVAAADAQQHRAPFSRFIVLDTYANAPLAASGLAQLGGTVVATKSIVQPFIRFSVVYADLIATIPPVVPVAWKEYQANQIATAAVNYETKRRFYANAGVVTTSEGTIIVWWF